MQPNEPPRLLKAQDAARCLGVTKSTVYDWIARGYLPCHRFGRTIRISVDDLEAYLARHRTFDVQTPDTFDAQCAILGRAASPRGDDFAMHTNDP